LIALGTILLTLGLSASPVHGQAPDQVGWWFELKTRALPVAPVVPVVPDGGMLVQQAPNSSPSAFGAVRYRTPSAASATLTLAAAQGSTTTLGAPLQACATSSAWVPPLPAPGYWEDAPKYGKSCSPGAVSSDGKFVAFIFGPEFLSKGALDVAIVPKDGATPFSIAFDKPAADSLVVKLAPAGTPTTVAHPVTTIAGGVSGGGGGGGKAPTVGSPSVVAPSGTPTTTAPASDNRPSVADSVLKVAGLGDPDRGERAVALSGASALVVGWWLLSTRATRMPHLLGALAGGGAAADVVPDTKTRIGGVGRFARKRTTNPSALR
jgi:hypothetical protein